MRFAASRHTSIAERIDDDVSLFLLHEFVVRARLGDEAVEEAETMEQRVAQVEAQMIEVEAQETEAAAKDEKASSDERTD
jgi:hypothetical protein